MVDERLNDVDSNMLACRNVLLDSVGVEKIFRVDPELYEDPEAAAKDYERVLKKDFPDFVAFSLFVLATFLVGWVAV